MLSLTLFLVACDGEAEVEDTNATGTEDSDSGGGETGDSETTPDDTETFTTPVAESVVGNYYNLDASSGTVVEPENGDLLLTMVEISFYLSIDAIAGANIDMTGVLPGDSCDTEFVLPSGDFSADPNFVVGPTDAPFTYDGMPITLYSMTLTGGFAADGSKIGNSSLEATVDLDEIAAMLDMGSGEDLCGTVDAMGISCVTCPDGARDVCIDLYITDMDAELDSSFTPVPC